MGKIKAIGLLSGGLDSTLAAKMIMEQGIEVHAINFLKSVAISDSNLVKRLSSLKMRLMESF